VASQIIAEFAIKDANSPKTTARTGLSTVVAVILAISAAPIALPLALSAIIIAFALIISLAAVLFSFFISGLACIVAGVFSAVVGGILFFQDFATALVCLGGGLFAFGIGLIFIKFSGFGVTKSFGWFAKKTGGFILRRSGK